MLMQLETPVELLSDVRECGDYDRLEWGKQRVFQRDIEVDDNLHRRDPADFNPAAHEHDQRQTPRRDAEPFDDL